MKQNTDKKQAVLITGVSSGIGKAIALELISAGFKVYGTVRKKEDGAYLSAHGGKAITLDITTQTNISEAHTKISNDLAGQSLFALINNAGIAVCVPWSILKINDFRKQLEVNLIGVAAITQTFLPMLIKAKGRIIMLSSVASQLAFPTMGPYACSKFALEALSDSLRRELFFTGVKVTNIQPGLVSTPIVEKSRNLLKERYKSKMEKNIFNQFMTISKKQEQAAMAPEKISRLVKKILLQKNPPTHKLVASNYLLFKFIHLFPPKLLDKILAKKIHTTTEKL